MEASGVVAFWQQGVLISDCCVEQQSAANGLQKESHHSKRTRNDAITRICTACMQHLWGGQGAGGDPGIPFRGAASV
eukprot:1152286-Pelagomonas_calceolata.AAC.7